MRRSPCSLGIRSLCSTGIFTLLFSLAFLAFFPVFLGLHCRDKKEHLSSHYKEPVEWRGAIFGTTFHIKFYLPQPQASNSLDTKLRQTAPSAKNSSSTQALFSTQADIQDFLDQVKSAAFYRLEAVDRSMSHWREDSELSRLNAHQSTEPLEITLPLFELLQEAKQIYRLSQGALDPARGGLFSLWGFGADASSVRAHFKAPSAKQIRAMLSQGSLKDLRLWSQDISVDEALSGESQPFYTLQKKNPRLRLDLSALAKGYAVDQVAELLIEHGIQSFMVEIGGEMRLGARKPLPAGSPASHQDRSRAWQIAVERPHYDGEQSILRVLALLDTALASSGNYRNYFRYVRKPANTTRAAEARLYSHIIDPRTGYPVRNHVLAVSVLGPECMRADGLATALMVLSFAEGKRLIDQLPDYEALWVLPKPQGQSQAGGIGHFKPPIQLFYSSGMQKFIQDTQKNTPIADEAKADEAKR